MRKRAEATLQEGCSLKTDPRSALVQWRIVREILAARKAAENARYQATVEDDTESDMV
jgi:hypothetical protein